MTASIARRTLLATPPNPDPKFDCLVDLDGQTAAAGEPAVGVHVRYVPDRLVLETASFAAMLGRLAADRLPTLEALALAILADLNDVLVPRWLEVATSIAGHRVIVADRQPTWQNEALLARLAPL